METIHCLKQFLFIKYWSGVECEDSWDTTNVPSFQNFDEAYDFDERRVITDNVQKHFALETVGFTHTAIAFKLGQRIAVKAAGIDNDTELPCS